MLGKIKQRKYDKLWVKNITWKMNWNMDEKLFDLR